MFKKIIRVIILIIVFIFNIYLIKIDVFNTVEVFLNGESEITINVFDTYEDEGTYILNNSKSIKNKLYDLEVINNIDNNTIGEYKIIYKYNFRGKEYTKERTINVIDKVSPTIKVANSVVYKYNDSYSEIYYKASDNYDGDLTNKVSVNYSDDSVTLTVIDSSFNETSTTIPIEVVDSNPIKITLNGASNYYLSVDSNYIEKGIKVFKGEKEIDDYSLDTVSSLDLSEEGDYEITYNVEYNGSKATAFRIIHVYNKLEKQTFNKKKYDKSVYLTFDDGPGIYTKDFLNVLDQYNIKATFFVTDQFNGKYLDLIKEEESRGHKIAIHTNSHQYSIYKSAETYINDFNTMNNKIEEKLGHKTNLFRFPGGSSNTISRNYSYGIVKYLANYFEGNGYVYFDWNVDSTDGAGSGKDTIIKNVLNGVRRNNESVVLMHDIHKSTLEALPTIIEELQSEGYTFRVLDETSITAHHSINN